MKKKLQEWNGGKEGGRKELRKARKMKKGNERRKEGEKKDAYYITNFKCLVSLA